MGELMKKLFILLSILITSSAFAFQVVKDYPSIPVSDALGTKKVSIKNFCMTSDNSKLVSYLSVCEKAKHIGRGYKKCVSRVNKLVEVKNSFRYTIFGPRETQREFNFKYDREVLVDVLEFDPRGGNRNKVDEFVFTLPEC